MDRRLSLRDESPLSPRVVGHTLLAVALMACAGCAGSQTSPDDPVRQVALAGERLKGTWILTQFQPEVPLEPMLAQLLGIQMGHLTATFDGTSVVAIGIGVNATRTYRILDASMDRFKLTLVDNVGVAYESYADFEPDGLHFQALTTPWTGRGVLVRQ